MFGLQDQSGDHVRHIYRKVEVNHEYHKADLSKTKDQNMYEMKREATDEFKNAKNEGRKLSELFPEVLETRQDGTTERGTCNRSKYERRWRRMTRFQEEVPVAKAEEEVQERTGQRFWGEQGKHAALTTRSCWAVHHVPFIL